MIFVIIGILKILVLNEPYLCNSCHDLMQKAMNFNDVAIVSVKVSDYRIHFWYISKGDATNIMKSYNLDKKTGLLWKFFIIHENEWNNLLKEKQRNNTKWSKRLLWK